MAIKFGLSIHGTINQETIFSRKNYFYPDLPKGYQISQDAHPIVLGGQLDISMAYNTPMFIEIARAHLEEDAGKSTHEGEDEGYSGINLNRAGIPLLEVCDSPGDTINGSSGRFSQKHSNLGALFEYFNRQYARRGHAL